MTSKSIAPIAIQQKIGVKEKKSKFNNIKSVVGLVKFDSKKELKRFVHLNLMQDAGEITGLERQKRFLLVPTQRDDDGNLLERGISYVADFVYHTKEGDLVCEDVKSAITIKQPEYIIKRKLMLFFHKIRILEIV